MALDPPNPLNPLHPTSMFEGRNALNFSAPGLANPGWLDIILQVPPHLLGQWGNCFGQAANGNIYDDFPCARATFGVYISPLIYRRENY